MTENYLQTDIKMPLTEHECSVCSPQKEVCSLTATAGLYPVVNN